MANDAGAVPCHMLNVHEPVGGSLQQCAKAAFALQQRTLAQVFAINQQQVKGIILEGRGLLAEAAAQFLEIGPAPFARGHDLAIKDGILRRKTGQRLADDGELGGPVETLAGIDDGPGTGKMGLRAVAVPLDLVNPVASRRRGVDRRGIARLDEATKNGASCRRGSKADHVTPTRRARACSVRASSSR
jgi:hypothetical protein